MTATLLFQSFSAVLIGWLLLHYAHIYHRKYLFYWSYSFFSLALFLLGSSLGLWLVDNNYGPSSPWRLINLFLITTAGYMQIAFLVIGTISLVKGTTINKYTFIRILMVCLFIAFCITVFKNWDASGADLRYLTRIGLRYFTAGLACLGTAIYILRNDPNPIIGKKIVTIGFFVYGFEMTFLGWLTFENYFFNGSNLLTSLIPYHGLFELILYPIIGVGLVVWLLEVERIKSKKTADQLKHLNLSDALTGLPNQQALQQFLQQWSLVAQSNEPMTLVLFGVDKMARFNDGEGFKKGNQLLIALAKRIDMLCRGKPFYGRIYGDVFVLMMSGEGQNEIKKAEKIRQKLSRPFKLNGQTFHLEVSAGITELNNTSDHEQAFNQANLALMFAKQRGGKQSLAFSQGMKSPQNTNINFENDLRRAFKNNQFELYFQPLWSSKNRIMCFEALIRWQHPSRGMLLPGAFLSMLQQMRMMIQLDFWVIDEAFKQAKAWRKVNADAAKININLSAETIQDGSITEHIKKCSLRHQLTPQHITVEITENTLMQNIAIGTNTLNELRELGMEIAIDDFGTGYSSLNYLRSFPADVIKFDRTFVSDQSNHHLNHKILKALIPLCHDLNKKVVVEGIENQTQFNQLEALNVDGFQGFYLSHPLAEKEATKMLTMSKKSMVKAMFNEASD